MVPLKCRFQYEGSNTWNEGVVINVVANERMHYPLAMILMQNPNKPIVRRILQISCERVDIIEPAATSEELVAWITAKRMMMREGT